MNFLKCDPVARMNCPEREHCEAGAVFTEGSECDRFNQEVLEKMERIEGKISSQIQELMEAAKEGRVLVLPFPLHKILLDTAIPDRPKLLKDFHIRAAWVRDGVIYSCPWDLFVENAGKGCITMVSEETQRALGGAEDVWMDSGGGASAGL